MEGFGMNKRLLKSLSLMSLMLLLSSNIAFASDSVGVSQSVSSACEIDTIAPLAAQYPIDIHGGIGEWGYGLFNMWGKYWHTTKSHRVVLRKDYGEFYGAWEDAGPT